jgi:hypothetical protein
MRKEVILRFFVLAIMTLAAFLILGSSPVEQKPASQKSIDECCQKKCKFQDDNLIWETFPRQFISVLN